MTAPELYACLYAREFPAQSMLRLRPELRSRPLAIMEGIPPLESVCSRNAKARIAGVVHGMTRVEVDTILSIMVLPRSRAEESAAKTALLECAGTFSPRIEDQSSKDTFLCIIDIAGMERLFGSPFTLAKTLLTYVRKLGIAGQLAISSNVHTAICLARSMSPGMDILIAEPGKEREALAAIPLTVLNLSESHSETFSLWGIHTLGALAALPQEALIARIGQEGKRLQQIVRGELPHLFLPIEAAFTLKEYVQLDTPVELLDSLLFVVGVMLEQLILRASARMYALASVTVTLALEGGASHSRTVKTALPTNDRQLWIKLLHLDLEAHPPQAAILALTLTAEPGTSSKVQLGLFSPQLPEPLRLDVTLARIAALVGENRVGCAMVTDTHHPNNFRMKPFSVPAVSGSGSCPARLHTAQRQLRPAESIAVLLHEERPYAFNFREKRYVVEHAFGPWRAGGEWWSTTAWGHEQWDLIARSQDGSVLCCCIAQDLQRSCWEMVTLYD